MKTAAIGKCHGMWLALSLGLCVGACEKEGLVVRKDGGGSDLPVGNGSGGAFPTGGAVGAGGMTTPGTGGLLGAGGRTGTGGIASAGGSTGAGGDVGAGGRTGAGGIVGAGGRTGTGGIVGVGGRAGTGGIVGAGGRTGVGGSAATGGTPGTGAIRGSGGMLGTGGSTAQTCGGLAGQACPSKSQFCEYPIGHCGKIPDDLGICVTTGAVACPAIYAPVCGCDQQTYGNDCERQAAGISKLSEGACPAPAQPCPVELSQIESWPCTEGLTCEYGTDPRPACRSSATCTNGAWAILQARCVPLPEVTCPDTREAAAGQLCEPEAAYCVYADLACECTNCSTGGPVDICTGDPTWHCAAPNADPACPAGIPLLGSACSGEGKSCTYACGSGGARVCKKGAWYAADGGPCPVSSRRAKRDIVYLTQAERRRIAEDLTRFKLATYEYRDPALAGRRHLGFIIEDVPGSPAVDRDGNMVDLYGYASMLVAAVQAQGEEIRKLKAELARLKRQGHWQGSR
jgi:hypothetical protein